MNKQKFGVGIVTLCLIFVSFFNLNSLYAQEEDVILLTDESENKGIIESETYSGVDLKMSGKNVNIIRAWDKIDKITYAQVPDGYTVAIESAKQGLYDDAIDPLINIAQGCRDGAFRKIFLQHTLYYLGLSYHAINNTPKAINAFEELLNEFPETIYINKVYPLTAYYYILQNEIDKANEFIANSKSKIKKEMSDDVKFKDTLLYRLDFYTAFAFEVQGNYADAVDEYKRIYKRVKDDKELKYLIIAAVSRSYVKMKDFSQVEEWLNSELFSEKEIPYDNGFVMVSAYNSLGDCILAKIDDAVDEDAKVSLLKEAKYNFMRGAVLYEPSPTDPVDEFARSYMQSAECNFRLISILESKEGEEDTVQELKQNTFDLLEELKMNYPSFSKIASKMQTRIK